MPFFPTDKNSNRLSTYFKTPVPYILGSAGLVLLYIAVYNHYIVLATLAVLLIVSGIFYRIIRFEIKHRKMIRSEYSEKEEK